MSDKHTQTEDEVDAKLKALNECGINDINEFIKFTDGFLKCQLQVGHPGGEGSVSGCYGTHLLQAIIKLFQHYQSVNQSRENALVITKLQEALMWAEERTRDRERRVVSQTDNK